MLLRSTASRHSEGVDLVKRRIGPNKIAKACMRYVLDNHNQR